MAKVFIDGSAGTTGLRIHERLAQRGDLTLITLPEAQRKDPAARKAALNAADIAFLCLPDAAAREAVAMIENPHTAVIDTSTAHRTAPGWVYGFPEIGNRRSRIPGATRIANPGCHASGFIALVAPLVERGLLLPDARLRCFSLTGYSGGGKKMIAAYEAPGRDPLLEAPRMYGLPQTHKHLPEMAAVCGLAQDPVFCPVVAPYYAGMQVTVPLFGAELQGDLQAVRDCYRDYYAAGLVRYVDAADDGGFLSAGKMAGRDDMILTVCGSEDRLLLIAQFDNLGKGASGAAVQNLNLLLGADEAEGLVIGGTV